MKIRKSTNKTNIKIVMGKKKWRKLILNTITDKSYESYIHEWVKIACYEKKSHNKISIKGTYALNIT